MMQVQGADRLELVHGGDYRPAGSDQLQRLYSRISVQDAPQRAVDATCTSRRFAGLVRVEGFLVDDAQRSRCPA